MSFLSAQSRSGRAFQRADARVSVTISLLPGTARQAPRYARTRAALLCNARARSPPLSMRARASPGRRLQRPERALLRRRQRRSHGTGVRRCSCSSLSGRNRTADGRASKSGDRAVGGAAARQSGGAAAADSKGARQGGGQQRQQQRAAAAVWLVKERDSFVGR